MKEELDQAESFKILQNAADGLRGIPDIHNKKDPVVKKWDEAKATVPKKHREAFYEKKYEEARNDKEWQRDRLREEDGSQDLSNKRTVFFTFAEAAKKNKLYQGFDFAHRQVELDVKNNKLKDKSESTLANLFIPETVDIDYSEYSDVLMFKDNIYGKPYKDGIMLVTDVEKGNRICIAMTVGSANLDNSQIDGKIIAQIYESTFRNYGQINWTDKRFDNQVVFYVVVPKIVKNKAVRIVFKNNIHLNAMVKHFRSEKQRQLPLGEFKNFYDYTVTAHTVITNLHTCREQEKKDPVKAANFKKSYNFSDKELLKAGYQSALIESANNCVLASEGKHMDNDFWGQIQSYENKSLEEIKQEYMKDVFPFEKKLGEKFFKKNLLKMVTLYYHTNKGTTLCNGTNINIDNKTKADCVLFWKKIDLFELLFNVLNDKNFPLCIRNSQIINNLDLFDETLAPHISLTPLMDDLEDATNFKKVHSMGTDDFKKKSVDLLKNHFSGSVFSFKEKHILEEAMDSGTGFLMPYDGVFEIPDDPIFKFVKFREYEDFITMLVCDAEERYFIEVFCKQTRDFKYLLWNQLRHSKDHSEECTHQIYTKLASTIRDGKVLIERDSTMGYRGRRKPYGSNTSSVYNIYFPRVSYRRTSSKEQVRKEKDFFSEGRNFSGSRRAHIRRLPEGSKPAKLQLILARKQSIEVPFGYTFVQKSMWGDKTMPVREKRYRTRSLHGIFYYTKKEVSEAEKIHGLSPAGFEEYCHQYLETRGWKIDTKKNYDGGIDIRALKEFEDGTIKNLLVQCKHWNKPIPPGEMRDFKAGCDEEDREHEKVLMFITSSQYSPGAREYAEKFNIELIDGNKLLESKT